MKSFRYDRRDAEGELMWLPLTFGIRTVPKQIDELEEQTVHFLQILVRQPALPVRSPQIPMRSFDDRVLRIARTQESALPGAVPNAPELHHRAPAARRRQIVLHDHGPPGEVVLRRRLDALPLHLRLQQQPAIP